MGLGAFIRYTLLNLGNNQVNNTDQDTAPISPVTVIEERVEPVEPSTNTQATDPIGHYTQLPLSQIDQNLFDLYCNKPTTSSWDRSPTGTPEEIFAAVSDEYDLLNTNNPTETRDQLCLYQGTWKDNLTDPMDQAYANHQMAYTTNNLLKDILVDICVSDYHKNRMEGSICNLNKMIDTTLKLLLRRNTNIPDHFSGLMDSTYLHTQIAANLDPSDQGYQDNVAYLTRLFFPTQE